MLQQRRELLDRMRAARKMTDDLFDLVSPEAMFTRPVAERHRLVFYLGHVDAFDWNLLRNAGAIDAGAAAERNEAFESLFAFGIDPLGTDKPSDRPSDWPSTETIRPWVAGTRRQVDAAISDATFDHWLENGWAIHLAIEHRLMHVETLSYLLSRLPLAAKLSGSLPSGVDAPPPRRSSVQIPAGKASLGLSRAHAPQLGWDNEYEAHQVEVPSFRIDAHKVTNADYLRFVEAGGYRERSLWTDRDWEWRVREDVEHPAFWIPERKPTAWRFRAMFAHVPLPLAWPVYVSHAEASAYARWRGARLPTEAEWHRALASCGATDDEGGGNFGLSHWDPLPVGRSRAHLEELVGNGWEWTCTPFAPFRDFEPLPFYVGYSANFFDDRHFVLKGASPRTPAGLVRPSFRNWFQPHYPYVYASFRCVDEGGTDDHGAS